MLFHNIVLPLAVLLTSGVVDAASTITKNHCHTIFDTVSRRNVPTSSETTHTKVTKTVTTFVPRTTQTIVGEPSTTTTVTSTETDVAFSTVPASTAYSTQYSSTATTTLTVASTTTFTSTSTVAAATTVTTTPPTTTISSTPAGWAAVQDTMPSAPAQKRDAFVDLPIIHAKNMFVGRAPSSTYAQSVFCTKRITTVYGPVVTRTRGRTTTTVAGPATTSSAKATTTDVSIISSGVATVVTTEVYTQTEYYTPSTTSTTTTTTTNTVAAATPTAYSECYLPRNMLGQVYGNGINALQGAYGGGMRILGRASSLSDCCNMCWSYTGGCNGAAWFAANPYCQIAYGPPGQAGAGKYGNAVAANSTIFIANGPGGAFSRVLGY